MALTIPLDRSIMRSLMEHEARLQATAGREVRDLGDAVLLLDPRDPEPYWNRLAAPDWPDDRGAFDRRLDAAITLFATLGRVPHIWPFPTANHPPDIVARLLDAGFEVMGSDRIMVLSETRATADLTRVGPGPQVGIERLHGLNPASLGATAEVAAVLGDAFAVGRDREASIELETLAAFEGAVLNVVLLRVDGEPATVAKRSTLGDASYLSSIGTRPRFRHQGLGALATAIATTDALAAGSRWVYLKVDVDNRPARRLYERLGFVALPGQVDDLLLRR